MKGFTLVELAIVLAIFALLVGGVLVPISARIDQQKISSTRKSIDLIKESLVGFAVVNGYLPCPAVSSTDGKEDRASGVCTKRKGFVPWVTLGTPRLDAWGHLYRYSVSPQFDNEVQRITLGSATDITIRTRDATGALVDLSNQNGVVAMVLSLGKDGYGATNAQGVTQIPPPAANVDEIANADGDRVIVSRTEVADPTQSGGAFDDIVDWISPFVLIERMVAAGRLP